MDCAKNVGLEKLAIARWFYYKGGMLIYSKIFLSGKNANGKYTLVDNEDYDELSKHNWTLGKQGYPTSRETLMHKFIMNTPKGMTVDHISGDKLDNRKENLRICTMQQNACNKGKQNLIVKPPTSRFKGVSYKDKHGWAVVVWCNNKAISNGHYETELEAGFMYNKMAKELHGEFANLNEFTDDEIELLNSMEIKNMGEKRRTQKYPNVYFQKNRGKWVWHKMIKGKMHSKSDFLTEEDAYLAFKDFMYTFV